MSKATVTKVPPEPRETRYKVTLDLSRTGLRQLHALAANVAVSAGDESWTYELYKQLANVLVNYTRIDVVVGIPSDPNSPKLADLLSFKDRS